MKFFDFLFGKSRPSTRPATPIRGRRLRLESLENRELLSVSTADFAAIQAQYEDLNLTNYGDYNIIEITPAQLTAEALQASIDTAARTAGDDLIVVRTDVDHFVVDLEDSCLSIDVDSSQFGTMTFVTLGSEKLRIQGYSENGLVAVANGEVAFGGVVFYGQENARQESASVFDLIQSSAVATVQTSRTLSVSENSAPSGNYTLFPDLVSQSDAMSGGAPIGSKSFSVTVGVGGTLEAYLTGLTEAEKDYILANEGSTGFIDALTPFDAEKNGVGDSLHCWAGTAANMLAYTQWGNVDDFQDEDDLFDYFRDNFTDGNGNPYYANEWFITGTFSRTDSGWGQPTNPDAGGFHPDVTNYQSVGGWGRINSAAGITDTVDKLKENAAVGLLLGWYNSSHARTGGHLITMWGAVYDASKSSSDSDYYVSLLVTDSDDDKNDGRDAPDLLKNLDIQWDPTNNKYHFPSYFGNDGFLEEYQWLAQRDVTPLSAPTLVSLTPVDNNSLDVKWTEVTNADGYTVQWATDAAFTLNVGVKEVVSPADSMNIDGLTTNTTYYVRVMAIGTGEYTNSTWSNVLNATLDPDTTQLTAPFITATVKNATTVTVDWAEVENASDYLLEWATNADFTNAQSMEVAGISIDILSLTTGTTYYFRVKAIGTGEYTDSNWSNVVNATPTASTTQLTAPAITATVKDALTVTVDWNAVANASGYVIEWATDAGFTDKQSMEVAGISIDIGDLATGTTYYFRVKAVGTDEYTDSNWSNVVDATPTISPTQLAAPTIYAIGKDATTVTVGWNAVPNASEYTVEWATDSTFSTLFGTKTAGSSATSTDISGLTTGTLYFFRVMAVGNDDYIDSNWSNVANATPTSSTTQLPAPTGVQASGKDAATVSVSWNAVTNADGYTVEWATDDNFTDKQSKNVTGTSTDIGNLATGTYFVRVMALGSGDYISSTWSSVRSVTLDPDTMQLPAPANVAATVKNATTVTVGWNAVANADEYTVEWAADSAFFTVLGTETAGPSATSTDIAGLTTGTRYYFRVKAIGSGNYTSSNWSDSADATPTSPLDAPAVSANAKNDTTVTVNWNAVSNVGEYLVEWATDFGFTDAKSETVPSGETSTDIADLTTGTTYYFRVKAIGSGAYTDSNWSNVVSAVPTTAPPTAPENFRSTEQTGNSVTLAWDEQPNLTGYTLEYRLDAGSWTMTAAPSAGATAATVKGLTVNTTYEFRLTAFNSYGRSSSTTFASTNSTIVRPPAPEATGACLADGGVELAWSVVDEADSYQVWRLLADDTWKNISGRITATSYIDKEAPQGTMVEYVVRSFKDDVYSDPAFVSIVTPGKPAAPVVTATFDADTGVTLTWPAVPGAETYKVYRLDAGQWVTVSEKNFTGTTFTDGSATDASATYGVRAYIGTEYSEMTTVSATPAPVVPPAPPIVSASFDADTGVTLTWPVVSGAETYKVYRLDGDQWVTVSERNFTGTSFTDDSAVDDSGTYGVRAYNKIGYSDMTIVSAAPAPAERPAPPVVSVSFDTQTGVTLTWPAVSEAETYKVYRLEGNQWVTISERNFTGTSFTDASAVDDSGTYGVRAYNSVGYSDMTIVSVAPTPVVPPAAPVVTPLDLGGGRVQLVWNAVENADSYKVWRRVEGGEWSSISVNFAETSFTDTSAPVDTTVYYAVRAYTGFRYGDFLEVSVVTTEIR